MNSIGFKQRAHNEIIKANVHKAESEPQFQPVYEALYADGKKENHDHYFQACERAFADFINDELKGYSFSSVERFAAKIEAARTLYGSKHHLSGY